MVVLLGKWNPQILSRKINKCVVVEFKNALDANHSAGVRTHYMNVFDEMTSFINKKQFTLKQDKHPAF